MMKRCFLLLLLALFAAPLLTRAEVLVYAGTARRLEPEESFVPRVWKCFVISNPVTGELAIISYGKEKGLKRRDSGSVEMLDYYPLLRLDGSNFDLYTNTELDKSVGVFQESLFLRGLQKTVTVRKTNGVPVTAQRAKSLKGSLRRLGIGLGYSYLETEILVRFDETRTVDANVRNVTVADVRTELNNFLSSIGYNL
jgi:hypothetical protein